MGPGEAIDPLWQLALGAPVRAQRLEACETLGDIAGRAFGADWEPAERAAFMLLTLARSADAPQDRRGVVTAMGRGFRNIWLLPFVHRRLSDGDPRVVVAAIFAAGGLGFPALEEALTGFLQPSTAPAIRRAAISALGRMGAMSAVDRLLDCLADPDDAALVISALTEIRSARGIEAARAVVDRDSERDAVIAAVRYLAELGDDQVEPIIRRLLRHEDARLRLLARSAKLALVAERAQDAGERFLAAMTESDRTVRAIAARRLRTVPIEQVLDHAHMLIEDDAIGVVQVLGELREPDITRFLLTVAGQSDLDVLVRARAVGSIEADQPWERQALADLATSNQVDVMVREAAVQALGAFAGPAELFERLGALARADEPRLRGAFLWALQLAVSPGQLPADQRSQAIAVMTDLLGDSNAAVRRRAAYVAGNLELTELAGALIELARSEQTELRLAALVALAELGAEDILAELVRISRQQTDPDCLAAASRAIAAIAARGGDHQRVLAQLAGKVGHSLADTSPLVREAAARLAGLCSDSESIEAVAALAGDPVPAVRAEALTALGRLGKRQHGLGVDTLRRAFEDPDPALHERAADALLTVGGRDNLELVIDYVAGEGDSEAREALIERIEVGEADIDPLLPSVDVALGRLDPDDPVYEALLGLKVRMLEARRPANRSDPAAIDQAIGKMFPSFRHMVELAGFAPLVRSLRTAETLYQSSGQHGDMDFAPPIVLWMKVLENYVHSWLGVRLSTLQRNPTHLFAHVDGLMAGAWPQYQGYVRQRWTTPVTMGHAVVEMPVRSLPNALRDLQGGRRKRLDSPMSITEWARLWVFFAVDHPSGVTNLFELRVASADASLRLAHSLHLLAAVRNLVTHRTAASAATVEAFRTTYYDLFESLAKLA